MTQTRRLAAILAADVAGYSRLMGADEEGTHERLQAHLGELVNPKIKEHRGRIVKNTGDGLLAEFASVVDAARCAIEVQRGMIDREPEVPEARRIRFRIGNLGDVIVEEQDIFGDGVNVAARLEAMAEPGGVCVSRVVRDQVALQKRVLRYAHQRMVEKGQTIPGDDPSKITVCFAAPDWLSEALTQGLKQVFEGRRRHIRNGQILDSHPWLEFFFEIAHIEETIEKAAAVNGQKRFPLSRLYQYAETEDFELFCLTHASTNKRAFSP